MTPAADPGPAPGHTEDGAGDAPGGTRTDGDSPLTDDDPAGLSYEQARDALVEIVRRLESGGDSLEESLRLWERGEALAARCEQWLDGARERMDALLRTREQDGPEDAGS
ncbi:MAG: exodeoxyribonuclease VII small subunit [Kineosporiaceae bacterium]